MTAPDRATAQALAEAAARRSYGRLLAFVAARTRDIAAAEDALSEAFATALAQWPQHGVPDNPAAWLLTAARRRLIDGARRQATQASAADELLALADPGFDAARVDGFGASSAEAIPDDRLRLMFACAHPGIAADLRAPLMLQTVLGFDAATIASAFRVAPSAMGQRLVRGKLRIRQAGIPFQVPEPHQLPERLHAVLEAIYAVYSDGWTDPVGTQAQRRALAEEALWLGRLIVALMPDEPEALGLLALMLYLESRRVARRDDQGEFVPLEQQDTALWDSALIREAEALLHRAVALCWRAGPWAEAAAAGAPDLQRIGRYQLEAALQSAHAERRVGGAIDWQAIVQLYDGLLLLTDSPVVAINRAVALAQAQGAEIGWAALQAVAGDARVADYQPYWAANAELLARLDRRDEALAAYRRAIGLEIDPAVRRFLLRRAAQLGVIL